MDRLKSYLPILYFLFSVFLVLPACERTMEKDVIKPVEMMVGQKTAAAAQAAVSNVRTVRAALMRYPAVSPTNEYPGEMEIYNYDTLRQVLADENLPPDMADLMWDPGFGIAYRSDGYTFTFEARALSEDMAVITATPEGVRKN